MKYTSEQLKPSSDEIWCKEKEGYFKVSPPNFNTSSIVICTGCYKSIYSDSNSTHLMVYETN